MPEDWRKQDSGGEHLWQWWIGSRMDGLQELENFRSPPRGWPSRSQLHSRPTFFHQLWPGNQFTINANRFARRLFLTYETLIEHLTRIYTFGNISDEIEFQRFNSKAWSSFQLSGLESLVFNHGTVTINMAIPID